MCLDMASNAENNNAYPINSMLSELDKVDDKLKATLAVSNDFSSILSQLEDLKSKLQSPSTDQDFGHEKALFTQLSTSIKTKFGDLVKAHREVHAPVSKFGKLADKYFVCDINHLAVHFNVEDEASTEPLLDISDSEPNSLTMDQYLHLVIVEHLFRTGQNKVALKLAEEGKLPLSEVGFQKFRAIYDLVGAIHNGHLQPAKAWLQENRGRLGDKVIHFEYAIAKLEFLSSVQQKSRDAKEILNFARKLAPYASEYRSDFEHLMGSLAFLGRSLDETPYTDLILSRTVNVANEDSSMEVDDDSQTQIMYCEEQDYLMGYNQPLMINSQASDDFSAPVNGTDLLMRVAAMFHTAACRQLGFSHIDPLFTAFSAGCRVLPKLHELKHAIESISKYSTDANTLPISVKLDPIAYRHNIFHCPVIKEMNHHPVRLFCGHAISRDAFNSLASSERSRIKCPYCPIDTQRNQVKDLKF